MVSWRDGRAGRDRVQRPPFGPGQAVLRCRQLLQQPPERRAQEWQLRNVPPDVSGQRGRLGAAQRVPYRCGCGERVLRCRDARRPQGLQLVRGQLAEPAEGWLAGERADDDQLECSIGRGREGEDVEELELVVQVVLEPTAAAVPPPTTTACRATPPSSATSRATPPLTTTS